MKSKEILSIIDKYIDKYIKEENPQDETVYRIPSTETI